MSTGTEKVSDERPRPDQPTARDPDGPRRLAAPERISHDPGQGEVSGWRHEAVMKVYDYHRSSAAYRLRIALNLKGMEVEREQVDLLAGEQRASSYRSVNPQSLVPALEAEEGVLTQSLAIIEYLDDLDGRRPLLPADPWARAQQRSMALLIACDVHPLNNLRVLDYLRRELRQEESGVRAWIARWISEGFAALEVRAPETPFLGGGRPMLADVVLIPQMYNARRYEVDLDPYPKLVAITARCNELVEFARATPDAT